MDTRLGASPQTAFNQDAQLLFLQSALTLDNPFNGTQKVLEWVQERNRQVTVNIERIPFAQMRNWFIDEARTKLQHSSGSFFSIEGINVQTNAGPVAEWDQPIINQPEIGYLGIITKEFNGILYFLLQAKIEPGNVNNVQLSPTLQATKSNYTKVHKGKTPNYLEYFTDRGRCEILLDQLQSEQGARFLKKRNRNIIIKTSEDIPVLEDYCWLTLGQVKELMRMDNVVNMDTRTVISGISYGNHSDETVRFYNLVNRTEGSAGPQFLASELNAERSLHSPDAIIHWFTNLKARYDLNIKSLPLHAVRDWHIEADSIRHKDDKFFRVIGVHVEIANREVTSWDQPLIEPVQEGICAFIVKEIGGIVHFLVQAKVESGNFDILEMAPTVQCITGSYRNENSLQNLPYLSYVLDAKKEQVIFDTLQSEEGGRFYREQNRNMILLADKDFPEEVPENYTWMTLNQLKTFIKFNNYLNIQARSLIAAIAFR
ncbi:MAG: NDP-hexose 2,3-dehydratase [Chitinophagaceae bacterium]|nr:MAG: NDP-hexose 2,3-dehydratase [Chitinophagaceae bacterium]